LPAAAEAAEASNAGTHDVAAAGRLATEPAHERAAPEGAPLRVLIVDDEAPVRELLADVLGAEGHRCSLAATGESALAVFRAGHFEVAIIDERLPGLSGGETARRLRVRDPVVGIVLVSGWGRPFPATAEGGRSPADFQADKPFEIAVLRDLVSRAGELARRRERGTGGEGAGG
jgi:two-component system OmpR family response regulator